MSQNVDRMVDHLEQRERLYRTFGLHDLADKIGERICQTVIDHALPPAQVTHVPSVGIWKGGSR